MIEDSGGWAVCHDGRPPSPFGLMHCHGILQKLLMECFPTISEWIITVRFRIYDASSTAVTCDNYDNKSETSYPTFNLMADDIVSSVPLTNTEPGDAILKAWNTPKIHSPFLPI